MGRDSRSRRTEERSETLSSAMPWLLPSSQPWLPAQDQVTQHSSTDGRWTYGAPPSLRSSWQLMMAGQGGVIFLPLESQLMISYPCSSRSWLYTEVHTLIGLSESQEDDEDKVENETKKGRRGGDKM